MSAPRAVAQPQPILLQAIVAAGRITRRAAGCSVVTSQALDWPGVLMEAGRNDVAAVDDFVGKHHYLSMNLDARPLHLEVKGATGFRLFTVPPLTAWISPSADPVTLRLNSALAYLRVSIDAAYLSRLISPSPESGQPIRLRRVYGVDSPQIARLMLTLRDEADSRNPRGLAVVEAVATALGHLLVRYAGIEPLRAPRLHGGLSAAARRRALELINARLDARLTVGMLAQEAGLSPAHFARAFRETMGSAPHAYILRLRLERARRLLEMPGATLTAIAQRTGFADQAHFTRLFRRQFGVTPGAVQRALSA